MKLVSKLVLQSALPAIVAVAVLLGIVSHVAEEALQGAAQRALAAVADARRQEVHVYLERMRDDVVTMGSAPAVVRAIDEFAAAFAACGDGAGSLSQHLRQPAGAAAATACRKGYEGALAGNDAFFRERHASYGWHDMVLVDPAGNVVYSLRRDSDFATNLLSGPWKDSGLARAAALALRHRVGGTPVFTDAERYQPAAGRPAMFLAVPVLDPVGGRPLGVLAVQVDLEPLDRHMHFKAGLGQTGEAFVVGTGGWLLTDTFFDKEFATLRRQLKTDAVSRALAGEEGNDQLIDYRGQESFIAYRPYAPFAGALGDQPRWGVIAKISRDEALASLYALQWLMLGSGVLMALAAVAFGLVSGRRLFSPLLAIKTALTALARGEKTAIPELDRGDEIGDMAQAADKFREMSETVSRDRRQREQVAALTTAVSQETRLTQVPDIVLGLLRQQLDVPVASMFLRDGEGRFVRAASQGLARRSQAQDSFAPGESLVGQCARDGQPVILSPVPEGLMLIATGLAEFAPVDLVLYPVVHLGQALAVVELAATRHLAPHEHDLLAALLAPLGLHLANIAAADRNVVLLGESRAQAEALGRQRSELDQKNTELQALSDEMRGQAEQLKAQNEEFRANQEELRAQQEELTQKNLSLESQRRQLEHSREEAETRARELAQSNQYKSQFLANMSHELRTPLNSILILAKHLADNTRGLLDKDGVDSARVIHESGSQLLSLINDILDLSKIEAGKLDVTAEAFAVSDMLLYLQRLFEPLAAKRAIKFAVDAGQTDPGTLHSDRRHLTQVLTNLLSNAIKFTDEGSVRLAVTATPDALQFDVTDTGIGIAADKLEHIFGAFQQLDGSTSRKYGGSGLGLAISRELTRLLGGELQVSSVPGSGSTFSVRLPRRAPMQGAAGAPRGVPTRPAPAPAPAPAARRAAVILVVEDDRRLVPIVVRLIETLGWSVRAAESGEEALALIAKEPPSAVLLDLGLPGMPGLEVLRRIKSDPHSAGIPVTIMSGAADSGEARTLGAAGYMRKPITRDAVLAAIRGMLDTAAPRAPGAAPLRVLLVEDDAASCHAVRVVFEDTPIEFEVAPDGAHGLAALASGAFGAVILDLTLPDMSGFEWLERAHIEQPRHPPVVVYSAREIDDAELLRLRTHASAVVSKGRLNGQTSARLRSEVLLALEASAAAPLTPASAGQRRSGSLLIVDDDVRNQSALSKVLRARGYEVSLAASGPQALELIERCRFDAVLTDIMMPDMDGFEFIRRLRSNGPPQLPVIAITAKAMPGDVDLCLAAGATDYLAKPVDIDRLLALLDQWL